MSLTLADVDGSSFVGLIIAQVVGAIQSLFVPLCSLVVFVTNYDFLGFNWFRKSGEV